MHFASSETIRKLSKKLFASIQFKIIVSTTLVMAIAVGLSTWFAVGSLEHRLLENTKHKLKTACERISENISTAMQNGHIPSIHRSFKLIRSYPHYEVQMFITDSLGTILIGTDSTQIGKKVKIDKKGLNRVS